MKLSPAHTELIKLLAAEAVDEFIENRTNVFRSRRSNHQENAMLRIPITEFTYDPITRKFFRYGQEWKAAGVDAVVGRVEGMKATEWLKLHVVGK